ncbi:exostosin domain-containing protein [Flavobacterium ajazii]|uniref:exostosin domain-containing protein n=1 Tax=Flavobacterium ajazii TaxID=2692318 RepID=UPI0013D32351|nr:exostosin family protein [Flavobacterium ajazii]
MLDLWYVPNANLLAKYQIVFDIEECDIAVIPIDIAKYDNSGNQKKLFSFISEANKFGKKIWIYSAGDFGRTIKNTTNVYTFRLGGFDSKLEMKTFIFPSFISDPLQYLNTEFSPLEKKEMPQIGFVGHANNSTEKRIKEVLNYFKYNTKRFLAKVRTDYQPFFPSSLKRFQLLKKLEKSNLIKTDFIYRTSYRAGVQNDDDLRKTTTEFFENIAHNPYTFCMRGAGNFSVRFYETLALGRIPIVVDTDFRLPFADHIDWKKHCLICKEENIVEAFINFHQKISSNNFEEMQKNNRKLWETHLEREAYFLQIYSIFLENKK